jgi:hypothetical protein
MLCKKLFTGVGSLREHDFALMHHVWSCSSGVVAKVPTMARWGCRGETTTGLVALTLRSSLAAHHRGLLVRLAQCGRYVDGLLLCGYVQMGVEATTRYRP